MEKKAVIFSVFRWNSATRVPGKLSSTEPQLQQAIGKFFSSTQKSNQNMLLCWPWWCRSVVPTPPRLKSGDVSSRLGLEKPKAGKSSVAGPSPALRAPGKQLFLPSHEEA